MMNCLLLLRQAMISERPSKFRMFFLTNYFGMLLNVSQINSNLAEVWFLLLAEIRISNTNLNLILSSLFHTTSPYFRILNFVKYRHQYICEISRNFSVLRLPNSINAF